MAALWKIQKDIDEQKKSIRNSAELVTEKVTENVNKILDEKFKTWEKDQENLKEKIEDQEQRLNNLEKHARQRNIVFFGIEENEKSYLDLETNVINFINKYFSFNLNCNDVQEVRRIGRKSRKPRPITVTFTTLGKKIKIMKEKATLKDTIYYIKEDYPPHVLEKRRMLQEQIKIEKEKGNTAFLKYDKLIILNNKGKPEPTDNRKRNVSISPQQKANSENIIPHKTQVAKKNKTFSARNTQRSTSFSEGTVKPGILNYLVNKNGKNQEETNNIA